MQKSHFCAWQTMSSPITKSMIGYLKKIGLDTRIHALEIFDYLVEAESIQKAETKRIKMQLLLQGICRKKKRDMCISWIR